VPHDRDGVDGSRPASSAPPSVPDAGEVAPGAAPMPGFFEPLTVPGHPDAWLSLPTGATTRRPVVVVVHGAGDRPDWQCGGWRHATDAYPFVVCPKGAHSAESTKGDERYTHAGGAALLGHIDAALAALASRYPDHADTSAPLLVGFSLGASEILALAVESPARFPRVALVEGAWDGWTDARVARFLEGGGTRVLYGCGQRACEVAARVTAQRLVRKGLDARVVFARVGHTFDVPLEEAVREQMGWLVGGDRRWGQGTSPP